MRNHLLVGLLFIAISAQAQQTLNFPIFRGNIGEQQLVLPVADSAKAVTAKAFFGPSARPLPANMQPYVIRSAAPGTQVVVRFEKTDQLPDVGWVEIYVAGQVRATGRLIVSKTAQGSNPPITQAPPAGNPSPYTSLTPYIKIIPLENAPPGYVINHGQETTLLTADFFWSDSNIRDSCYGIEIDSENKIHTTGPPTERFFGKLVLTFYKLTTK